MLNRIGTLILCAAVTTACSSTTSTNQSGSNGSSALTDIKAACSYISQYGFTQDASQKQQLYFDAERKADAAAGMDPQWRALADDLRAWPAAFDQDRAAGTGGAFTADRSNAVWNRIVNDCRAVNAGS